MVLVNAILGQVNGRTGLRGSRTIRRIRLVLPHAFAVAKRCAAKQRLAPRRFNRFGAGLAAKIFGSMNQQPPAGGRWQNERIGAVICWLMVPIRIVATYV